MFTRLFLIIPASIGLSFAQEVPPNAAAISKVGQEPPPDGPPKNKPAEVVKPTLVQLDETRYRLGEVILDRKTREIRFPAKVNMTEGAVEFAIVHLGGAAHESLATSTISPTELNLAFTLLRYKPSVELFSEFEETGHPTGLYPQVPIEIRVAAHIDIDLEWTEKDETHRVHLSQCLESDRTGKPMEEGPWLYTGEDFGGDLVAMRLNRYSMINDIGADRDEEGSWHLIPKILPPVGTNLTVIISRYTKGIPLRQY
jgi:hypothetical protein